MKNENVHKTDRCTTLVRQVRQLKCLYTSQTIDIYAGVYGALHGDHVCGFVTPAAFWPTVALFFLWLPTWHDGTIVKPSFRGV